MNKMNKKGSIGAIGIFILLFIGVIVSLAMFPAIADSVTHISEKSSIVDEVVSVAPAKNIDGSYSLNESIVLTTANAYDSGTWASQECPYTGITVKNGTDATLTVTTDYVFDADAGTLVFKNTTTTEAAFLNSNSSQISYTFCPEGYATSSGARTMAKMIVVFSALALFGFVIWSFGKGSGWLTG